MQSKMDIRPSPIAGQWYQANATRLAAQIDRFMDEAELPEIAGEIVEIMAPHAGHIYSGAVAGYAFAAVRGLSPELVAVVSPMHHPYFEPILTSAHSAYATPLGTLPIAEEVLDQIDYQLQSEIGVRIGRISNDSEHSLEIELPFLQRALTGSLRLVPIMLPRPERTHGQGARKCTRESAFWHGKVQLSAGRQHRSVALLCAKDCDGIGC